MSMVTPRQRFLTVGKGLAGICGTPKDVARPESTKETVRNTSHAIARRIREIPGKEAVSVVQGIKKHALEHSAEVIHDVLRGDPA